MRFSARRLGRTLRYRFRLQRSEYPPPPTSLPPLVDEPAPLLPAAQVAVARTLGAGYLLFDRLRERYRIARSPLPATGAGRPPASRCCDACSTTTSAFKSRLPERSHWFRRMPVRLGTDAYE